MRVLRSRNWLITKLAEAEVECADWQGCVEAVEAILIGDKPVPPASIQASCMTAAEHTVARIRDLERTNAELQAHANRLVGGLEDLEKANAELRAAATESLPLLKDAYYSMDEHVSRKVYRVLELLKSALAATAPVEAKPEPSTEERARG